MLNKVLSFADEFCMLPEGEAVLACVSGGADSMCLLDALIEISKNRAFSVSAAHFNHKLRGAESERDEDFVREYCAGRGVPFYYGSGDARAHASKRGLNLEAAARDLRYSFFYEAAALSGASRIATAHTADDNAETMLLNFARGAGAGGLSGIPPVRGSIIRPMLGVSREEVTGYAARRGVPFVRDSTNDLDIYSRNRIRHNVVPVLRGINPGFTQAASSAAALSRADEEFLSRLADEFIAGHSAPGAAEVKAGELLELPTAVSGRVIRKLHGGSLSHRHVETILKLCGKAGPPLKLSLPGADVYIEYGRVVFAPAGGAGAAGGFATVGLTGGGCAVIPELGLKISCESVICGSSPAGKNTPANDAGGAFADKNDEINKSFTSFLFKSVDIYGKMTVRSRREGDAIKELGRNGTKTLKKLFIERRIPARERALVPVIADEAGVLAIYGLCAGSRAVPTPGDPAYKIDFEEI